MNESTRRRIATAVAAAGITTPMPDLAGLVAVMTPQDRATWDRIATTYEWPGDDPDLAMKPDDYEALVGLLSRTLERLGVEVDPVWRSGAPIRYRSDHRRYGHLDPAARDRPVGLTALHGKETS